jgi:hypothetical protein
MENDAIHGGEPRATLAVLHRRVGGGRSARRGPDPGKKKKERMERPGMMMGDPALAQPGPGRYAPSKRPGL